MLSESPPLPLSTETKTSTSRVQSADFRQPPLIAAWRRGQPRSRRIAGRSHDTPGRPNLRVTREVAGVPLWLSCRVVDGNHWPPPAAEERTRDGGRPVDLHRRRSQTDTPVN
jgi:hypothetical protein